ncbi:MAG: zinc ribbon domain-containing protein [Actinobacteria bacterium]|nr:zinc ribbon domain-containing protein [Actinomycetota bacterium]
MPTYGLHCLECGHRFDLFVMRLLRESDRVCPECGSAHVAAGVGGGLVVRSPESVSACAPKEGFG